MQLGADFGLTSPLIGLNIAIVAAAEVFTGPFSGLLIDRFGRRNALMLSSSLILISSVLQVTATTGRYFGTRAKLYSTNRFAEVQFVIARFILGMALSIIITAAPAWVMELAKPGRRILMVSILVTLVPISSIIGSVIIISTLNLQSNWAWRAAFMVCLITAG